MTLDPNLGGFGNLGGFKCTFVGFLEPNLGGFGNLGGFKYTFVGSVYYNTGISPIISFRDNQGVCLPLVN